MKSIVKETTTQQREPALRTGTTEEISTTQPQVTSYRTETVVPSYTQVGEVAREVHVAPTVVVEKLERPVVVRETILPTEKIEVQPVIHREREQLEFHEVVQPFHERDVIPTSVRHATLPAQVRPEIRESDTAFQSSYRDVSTRFVPEVHTEAVQREFVNRPAIIEEHVHRKVVEEIQPVLYRETISPVVIEETQPIYEKIVEAPRMVEEVRQMVDLGTRYAEAPTSQIGKLSLGTEYVGTYGTTVQREGHYGTYAPSIQYVSTQPYGTHSRTEEYLPYGTHLHTGEQLPHGTHLHTGEHLPHGTMVKETTITKETIPLEPHRAASSYQTETKRIV